MTIQQQSANAFNNYIGLIQQGMSPLDAYRQSGLSDLAQGIARRQSSQQTNAAMGQIGGKIVGKLGAQAVKDAIAGKPILGGLRTDISNAATSIGNLFNSGIAQTAAQNAAWNAGAGAASQAAWNAGADAATAAAANTGASVGTSAGAGAVSQGSKLTQGLGAVGTAVGAYNAYKGIESGDPVSAGMGGASMGAGLAAMGMALGPVGWAAMIAAPVIGAMFVGNRKSATEKARDRNKEQTDRLREMGYTDKQLQQLGRIDSQGRSVYFPDTQTKEEREASGREWSRIKASPNPNENPFRIPTAMWTYEGMLSAYGPEYLNNMREFDRYMATAAAIEMGGGFYNHKGEVLLRDQKAAKAAYEAAKNDPKKYAEYQARYENWKNTGVDTGFDWTDIDRQYGNFKAGDTRTVQRNVGSGDNPIYQPVTEVFDGKLWQKPKPGQEIYKL